MTNIYFSKDKKHFSIQLEGGLTKAFSIYNYIEDAEGNFIENGLNENLEKEVNEFVGDGFYKTIVF